MGPGHLGIGFAAKPLAPDLPLWALLVSSEAIDLLSLGFKAIGIEEFAIQTTSLKNGVEISIPGNVPWSHGFFMTIIWSLLAMGITYLFTRNRRSSNVIGMVVFSHWILDFIVHPPYLPLFFEGSPMLGLGLWSSGPGLITSFFLEAALLLGGMAIYLNYRKQKPTKQQGV